MYCEYQYIIVKSKQETKTITTKGGIVIAKSASVYARIDPVLKEQAETILSTLGIPTSNAIDMFFKQIVLKKGLPFEVRLPYEKPVCMGALSKEELNAKIEKGYTNILEGKTKPAKQAFDEMRKDYNLQKKIEILANSLFFHNYQSFKAVRGTTQIPSSL